MTASSLLSSKETWPGDDDGDEEGGADDGGGGMWSLPTSWRSSASPDFTDNGSQAVKNCLGRN
jgi:hypothetical protein